MSKNKQNNPRPTDSGSSGTGAGRGHTSPSRREQLRAEQAAAAKLARARRIVAVIAGVVALAVIAVVVFVLVQNTDSDDGGDAPSPPVAGEQLTPPNANPAQNAIRYPAANPAPADAPVVEVYMDFQCPGCAQAAAIIDPMLESLADRGEIHLDFHILHGLDTPLNTDYSRKAAIGASCADVSGFFAQYTSIVFANQPAREGDGWTDDQLRSEFPQQAGINGDNLTSFQACFDTQATEEFVGTMQDSLPQAVRSTPGFVVNGQLADLYNSTTVASEQALLDAINAAANG